MMEAARAPAIPESLAEATRHQPRARAALMAALGSPSHAYIFRGPRGAGKAAAARAFAAELLTGAHLTQRTPGRVLLDPSPHPDLAWLRPPGAPGRGRPRVGDPGLRLSPRGPPCLRDREAEDLRDESQNALLKTLEEPAPFAHLILICSEPEQLAETILSRCAPVEFGPLAPDAVLEALGAGEDAAAAARLSGGDVELARLLLGEGGSALRATAEAAARAARRARRPNPGGGSSTRRARPARRPARRRRSACWRRLRRWRSAGARASSPERRRSR
jgi:DNA polymerase-3 subunit delta'